MTSSNLYIAVSQSHFSCGGLIPFRSIERSSCCTRSLAMSSSCFTFHRCVSQIGSLQRWWRSISCASNTAPLNVNDLPRFVRRHATTNTNNETRAAPNKTSDKKATNEPNRIEHRNRTEACSSAGSSTAYAKNYENTKTEGTQRSKHI